MKSVGLCGPGSDPQIRYVAEAVARLGEPVPIDTSRAPERLGISWQDGRLVCDGRALDPLNVFYLKGVPLSLPAIDPAELPHRSFARWQDRLVAERERQSFLGSVLRDVKLRGACVVNPVESIDLHFLKMHQVSLLARSGIPVPPSLATCDPEAVREFAARHGPVIYKPLAGGAHVQLLGEADLAPDRLACVRASPVLFQAQVPGTDEFRAYVLDGEPLAAFHIDTTGVVDARDALDRCRPAELAPEAWDICVRGARALGLVFTAADLRRRPDGGFVALEFNPTPAVAYFEDPREGRVIRRLAEFLMARA